MGPIIHKCLLKVLCPVSKPITTLDCVLLKENKWAVVAQVRARNQFPSLSLCTTRTTPHYHMLVFHPAFQLSSYILPWDPPRKALVQQTVEKNRPLRACRRFHFLALRNGQRESGIRFQAGARDFSLLLSLSRQALGPTPPRVLSTAVEWPGWEDEHAHLVNNASTIPSFPFPPPHVFTVRCLIQQCGISSIIHQPFTTDAYRIWKFRKQCID